MTFVMTYDDGQALLKAAGALLISGELYLPEQIAVAIKKQCLGLRDGQVQFRTERLVKHVAIEYFGVRVEDKNHAGISGAVCQALRRLEFHEEQRMLIQMMSDGAQARAYRDAADCTFIGVDVCDQVRQCHDYDGHELRGYLHHTDANGRHLSVV